MPDINEKEKTFTENVENSKEKLRQESELSKEHFNPFIKL